MTKGSQTAEEVEQVAPGAPIYFAVEQKGASPRL